MVTGRDEPIPCNGRLDFDLTSAEAHNPAIGIRLWCTQRRERAW